ncbi:receptor-like protein kinase HERK 1 isoform X2 [Rutidosis leptorrhynchoides]
MDEYLASITIPYEEIAEATNNFADENIISQRTSGVKLYKGQLISESGQLINIVAGVYPVLKIAINELKISFCAYLKNRVNNIHSVFKVSEYSDDVILISKHLTNGSLNKHLSDSQTLTWMQRLHICVGVAHALNVLHVDDDDDYDYDDDDPYSFIHGNIKSSKILLDEHWEPKLSGFGYSMTVKRGEAHRPTEYWDKSGYRDPAYNDTKCLSTKSDVFSFGVVLFEVLFGLEASTYTPPNQDEDHWNFAKVARQHYEEKRLDYMIDPDLRKQMNLQSLTVFSETAHFCLKEVRSQRPYIDQVVRKLEKALQLQQKHDQNQKEQFKATEVESRISRHLKGKNMDHLKIQLSDIELATQIFSEVCKIGSGGYGAVYKAELYHFDGTSSSTIEAKIEDEFPKKRSTVAIKRIFQREDMQGEQGFLREIELLSK